MSELSSNTAWEWHNGYPVGRIEREQHGRPFYLLRMFALVGTCVTLMFLSFLVGIRVGHEGRILPGVAVHGIEVAGYEPDRATVLLQTKLPTPSPVTQVQTAVTQAYDVGRKGDLFNQAEETVVSLIDGVDVAPVWQIAGAPRPTPSASPRVVVPPTHPALPDTATHR